MSSPPLFSSHYFYFCRRGRKAGLWVVIHTAIRLHTTTTTPQKWWAITHYRAVTPHPFSSLPWGELEVSCQQVQRNQVLLSVLHFFSEIILFVEAADGPPHRHQDNILRGCTFRKLCKIQEKIRDVKSSLLGETQATESGAYPNLFGTFDFRWETNSKMKWIVIVLFTSGSLPQAELCKNKKL